MKNKYNYAALVEFKFTFDNKTRNLQGYVAIIDKYGTFEQNEEPSYDVLVDNFGLVKHIREHSLKLVKKADKDAIKHLKEVF